MVEQQQGTVQAAISDNHQQQINALAKAIVDLRDKTTESEAHIVKVAWEARHNTEHREARAQQEFWEAESKGEHGSELVPYVTDVNKLPVRYSDKSFWYLSLPLAHTTMFFKRISRWVSSFIVMPDASVESTRLALEEAHQERELLNIIRIQQKVEKIKRAVSNAIRQNKDSLIKEIGKETAENVVASQVLKQHFQDTGMCSKAVVTSGSGKLWLHLEMTY